jgi:NAD(P)-dependent dehydrogenase (short-subunit alcohol dehydrogenase family)
VLTSVQMARSPPDVRSSIVNITSVDAFTAHPQDAHHATAKAAVVSLSTSLARAVAPDDILVTSIAPTGMAPEKARQSGFHEDLATAGPPVRGTRHCPVIRG